jgi:hypothetical protein
MRHLEYIRSNPIEARLVSDAVLYEFIGFPNSEFPRGLKPGSIGAADVRAEARTLQLAHSVETPTIAQKNVLKGTGLSPFDEPDHGIGDLAPEGGNL